MGILTAGAIFLRPEGLRAPAYVAYAATGAFVIAGLVVIAAELRAKRVHSWLVVMFLLAMFTPPAWIAFGEGERACVVGGAFSLQASGLICRAAFGTGAILLAFMLFIAWRAAHTGKHGD